VVGSYSRELVARIKRENVADDHISVKEARMSHNRLTDRWFRSQPWVLSNAWNLIEFEPVERRPRHHRVARMVSVDPRLCARI